MTGKRLTLEKIKLINVWRTDQMYDYYFADVIQAIDICEQEINQQQEIVNEIINDLKTNGKDELKENSITITGLETFVDIKETNPMFFTERIYGDLFRLDHHNKKILELNRSLIGLKKKLIDKKKFKFIIKAANDKIIDNIIQGDIFNPGHNIGRIYVKRTKQHKGSKRRPDWRKSYEKRDQLVADGKIPKSKEHPEGEEWIVPKSGYFDFRIVWKRGECKIKNGRKYLFSPTKLSTQKSGRKTFVTRLYDYLDENPLAHVRFIRD